MPSRVVQKDDGKEHETGYRTSTLVNNFIDWLVSL